MTIAVMNSSGLSAIALPRRTLWPVLALIFNALVWGLSWWPLRHFEGLGLHPLWATMIVFALVVLFIVSVRPNSVMQLLRTPSLWVLVLAAGTTNAAFNWGVVIGDVVRVVLLFYLMPLWAVLLARWLLNEPLTAMVGVRVLLALAGAALVLWPVGQTGWASLPVPRSLPDWLGVIGGMSFALNNVMLRREAHRPEEGRALAMFLGGGLVAGLLATVLALNQQVPWAPAPAWSWAGGVVLLAGIYLVGNLSLQFGAARLPANVTAVVMLTEVLFASASALAWGGGQLNTPLVLGGALILLAAGLSAFEPAPRLDAAAAAQ
jgi:drug/metabolite transporter (DMT)-like permease